MKTRLPYRYRLMTIQLHLFDRNLQLENLQKNLEDKQEEKGKIEKMSKILSSKLVKINQRLAASWIRCNISASEIPLLNGEDLHNFKIDTVKGFKK